MVQETVATCFMAEETDRQNRYLRRFTYGEEKPCPEADGDEVGHDAWELMDTVENPAHQVDPEEAQERAKEADENGNLELLRKLCRGDLWPHDDRRWPEECELCGYEFTPEDEWQLHQKDIWRPVDPELLEEIGRFELRNAPVGAMWDAYWLPFEGPDGRCLVVRCPDGWEWVIDGRATNADEGGWERKGKPPKITVSPSIGTPGYHGFLINGELTADLEGREYG